MTTGDACGSGQDELPDISSEAPYHWMDSLDNDCDSLLTSDLCIIQARDYFIRGVIHIPIQEDERDFGWGVWVSQKKENFEDYREHYDTKDIGPFFGWLSTDIDFFSTPTVGLKTTAHFSGGGLRPRIVVHECDHPLYYQQRDGLALQSAWDIVHCYIEKSKMAEQGGAPNHHAFGTFGISPAEQARMPKASGDR